VGIDASPAMIALARERVPAARFRTGTIARARLPRCEAMTAFGECFNYRVGRASSLAVPFARVRRALAPGGLFVFDVREASRGAVPERFAHTVDRDWAVLVRVSERGLALTRFITTFRRAGQAYRRSDEVHRLRLYTRAGVLRALRRAGFEARVWPARRTAVAGHGPASLTRFVARA
jgi:SAM-dependent methyltransferase